MQPADNVFDNNAQKNEKEKEKEKAHFYEEGWFRNTQTQNHA
jgi:hypothetical protein